MTDKKSARQVGEERLQKMLEEKDSPGTSDERRHKLTQQIAELVSALEE